MLMVRLARLLVDKQWASAQAHLERRFPEGGFGASGCHLVFKRIFDIECLFNDRSGAIYRSALVGGFWRLPSSAAGGVAYENRSNFDSEFH
jgi:hypothetical protein